MFYIHDFFILWKNVFYIYYIFSCLNIFYNIYAKEDTHTQNRESIVKLLLTQKVFITNIFL